MMKFSKLSLLILVLVMCLICSLLVACGEKSNQNDNVDSDVVTEEKEKDYKEFNIEVVKGQNFGEVKATPVGEKDGGTLYEFVVTPKKEGYEVDTFKVGGEKVPYRNGKASCIVDLDTKVEVTYKRKTNEELEKRREKVLEKMKLITGTQFRYDKDYNYSISSKDMKIDSEKLYQGMPYSNVPTLSFDAFLDFTTGKDDKGVYTVGNIMANNEKRFVWGNNCADVVYWAWSMISTTVDSAVSWEFNERYDCVYVGDFVIEDSDFAEETNGLKDTAVICQRNREDVMYEAYALMAKGDGLVFYHGGGHVIMVGEVKVARNKKGEVDGDRSYIKYYEQNAGYSEKNGVNGEKVMSSCGYDVKMTFRSLYSWNYIPITIKELIDEKYTVEKETIKDSVKKSELNASTVTQGVIESNYFISKAKMEITDKNGNVIYDKIRYRDEKTPRSFDMSWFTMNETAQYMSFTVYNDKLDFDSIPAGEYNCKVTVFLATGYSEVVRDFKFTK